ncbi:hypothetical protein ID866_5486 [Astraeus odoratus]|nr:hypothetical protein ID866_5486 [Astraeus odoratus]
MGRRDEQLSSSIQTRAPTARRSVTLPRALVFAILLCVALPFLLDIRSHPRVAFQPNDSILLANHCRDAEPIPKPEFLERQQRLAQALRDLNASAYVAEPGASAGFFGNISHRSWDLSDRPLLLLISPTVKTDVAAKVTVLTPYFEETRARLLSIPGMSVSYASWKDDENPYTVAMGALQVPSGGRIYVDDKIRHFIVAGFQKAAPGAEVVSAPWQITSLRERKSPAELLLLQCVNEATVLAIRAVQKQMHIGIRESEVKALIDSALSIAGVEDRWALVLFGGNAALHHNSGTDRELRVSDFVLIDTGGTLFGYHSDVTRTFALPQSQIPDEHYELWYTVRAAQIAALNTAKAGVVAAKVDSAARAVLSEHGLDPYFTHRLGHGIGLEDHEEPYLRGGSYDIIRVGHTFSNEPGVYIEGKVGIRLEDCMFIGLDGDAVYLTAGVGGPAMDPLHP